MMTLRLVRNLAALFIFVIPLLIPQPSDGKAIASHKSRCVKTSYNTNCSIVNGVCNATICYFGCTHTTCASN